MSFLGALGGYALMSGIDYLFGSKQQESNNAFNAHQAHLNRQFQREERLAVQDYNTEMWNKTNEYNSLESQIKRARVAGVSPNAIIGQGGNMAYSGPQSSPSHGAQASSVGLIDSNIMQNALAMQQLDAQTRNIESETSWNNASLNDRLRFLKLQGDKLATDVKLSEQQYTFLASKNSLEIQTMTQELNILKEELKLKSDESFASAAKRAFMEKHGLVPGLQEHEQLFGLLSDGKLDTLCQYLGANAAKVASVKATENITDILTGGIGKFMKIIGDFVGITNPKGR